jgi:dTDP-4-dehydrorhamnose 3,5-epimerase-like enzyme
MDYRIDRFEKHNDARGQLVVFLKNRDLAPGVREFGQIYFVTFEAPGVVRGNHFHKRWREWFGVVSGKLQVRLQDVATGECVELLLDGDSSDYVRLEVGPSIAHAFKNVSPTAALLNYTDIEWSPHDTFHHGLLEPSRP